MSLKTGSWDLFDSFEYIPSFHVLQSRLLAVAVSQDLEETKLGQFCCWPPISPEQCEVAQEMPPSIPPLECSGIASDHLHWGGCWPCQTSSRTGTFALFSLEPGCNLSLAAFAQLDRASFRARVSHPEQLQPINNWSICSRDSNLTLLRGGEKSLSTKS